MNNEDAKIAHLGFIQDVIKRMANNSFLLKGWSITVVAALLKFPIGKDIPEFYLVGMVFIFCCLDSFYLKQERLFRKLYDEVAKNASCVYNYSMNTAKFNNGFDMFVECLLSPTILGFYFPLMFLVWLLK